MRFVAFYVNTKELRDQAVALIISALSQGVKLNEQVVKHPAFSSQPSWPNQEALRNLPLDFQCEELEYVEGSLRTLRQHVIDVEVISSTSEEVKNA